MNGAVRASVFVVLAGHAVVVSFVVLASEIRFRSVSTNHWFVGVPAAVVEE